MRKTIAIVLLALMVCSVSVFALTLPKVPKIGAVSGISCEKPVFDISGKLFADRFKDVRSLGSRVRIPVEPCVTQATPETFDSLVLESSLPVVVDFWAPWCGWCTRFKPVFDQSCEEYRGRINFVGFNTDLGGGIQARYGVRGIPAQIAFNDGTEVSRNVGYVTISVFRGWLDTVLGSL